MKKQVSVYLPSLWGAFHVVAYAENELDSMPHLAIAHPKYNGSKPVLVRIHSECLTGDLLGSRRCDCGEQLHRALELINDQQGILLYLRQEGRGIGLINKLKAYNLQDKGLNTIDANHQLGFEADERNYKVASQILKDLNVRQVKLLTNNPSKIESLQSEGIEIVERIPLKIEPQEKNKQYLKTKKDLMGHLLD